MSNETLKFHVVAEMSVTLDEKGSIVTAEVTASRIATKPEDKLTEAQLAKVMANKNDLLKLAGVLLVQRVQQKENPKVQLAGPRFGDKAR